ncbi:alkaline phosphatase [Thermodesulfatator indicus]
MFKKLRFIISLCFCLLFIQVLSAHAFTYPDRVFFHKPQVKVKKAKYVILLIGDGMGYWHVDALRRYLNVSKTNMESLRYFGYMTTFMRNSTGEGGLSGEYWDDPNELGSYDPALGGRTPWEIQPVPAYVDEGATDSAAAGSALASGHKTVKYALNVVPKPEGYPADEPFTVKYYPTIVDFAEAKGMATGVVTSVPFSHATPAAFIAKTQYRKNYGEIARQMIFSNLDVIMGAGHPYYDDNGNLREEPNFYYWSRNKGPYIDDEDGEALYEKVVNGVRGRVFVDKKEDFEDLADGDGLFHGGPMPRRVFGLAQVANTLQASRNIDDGDPSDDWKVGGQAFITNVPSLETMTRAALEVLEQDEDGFFVMIEGGAIDWASHANNMTRMLEEIIDFDNAVKAVVDWVNDPNNGSNWDNTLVVVVADHETGHLQPLNVTGDEVIKEQCWGLNCEGWHHHTNSLVPIYAQGVCARALKAKYDGDIKDNTQIFKVMYQAIERGCYELRIPE